MAFTLLIMEIYAALPVGKFDTMDECKEQQKQPKWWLRQEPRLPCTSISACSLNESSGPLTVLRTASTVVPLHVGQLISDARRVRRHQAPVTPRGLFS